MLKRNGTGNDWYGTHIGFISICPPPNSTKKTKTWAVVDAGREDIGVIKWYTAWRKYCFFPLANTVYEQVCLGEIAQFITDRTTEHKAAAKAAKPIPVYGYGSI